MRFERKLYLETSEIIEKNYRRIQILVFITVIQLCALAEEQRPNFVFLFADDLGWGILPVTGIPTPKRRHWINWPVRGPALRKPMLVGRPAIHRERRL